MNTIRRSFRRGYTLFELIFTILLAAGGLFVIVFAFYLLRLVINLGA